MNKKAQTIDVEFTLTQKVSFECVPSEVNPAVVQKKVQEILKDNGIAADYTILSARWGKEREQEVQA